MASSELVTGRIRAGFGGLRFMVAGHMCVVDDDVLIARVGPDQYEKELEPCQGFIRTLPPN